MGCAIGIHTYDLATGKAQKEEAIRASQEYSIDYTGSPSEI